MKRRSAKAPVNGQVHDFLTKNRLRRSIYPGDFWVQRSNARVRSLPLGHTPQPSFNA
jgi:hypothetical protein